MIDLIPYEGSAGFIEMKSNIETAGFIDKLMQDIELTDAEKGSFCEHVSNYSSPVHRSLKAYCEGYFRANKFLGINGYNAERTNLFVRIKDISRFKFWIAEIVASDVERTIDELLDDSTEAFLRQFLFEQLMATEIRDDIVNDSDSCKYYLAEPALSVSTFPHLREAKTDAWMVWSFPFPKHEDDIFSKAKINNLDCRAGLLEFKSSNKIIYLHSIESCANLKKPTVFDAEFYVQFLPGGKTKPLDECSGESGFDEYVHDPNKFKHIKEISGTIMKGV